MRRNFCFYVLISLMLTGFSSTAVSQFGDPVPRRPQEMDGPVNVLNKAIVFSETDIAVPGRGLGIEFTRYYNSAPVGRPTYDSSYMGWRWFPLLPMGNKKMVYQWWDRCHCCYHRQRFETSL